MEDWRGEQRKQAKSPYVRWGADLIARNAALRALFPEGSVWKHQAIKKPWKVRYVNPHGYVVMDLVKGTGTTFLYPYEEGPDDWTRLDLKA